jgi:hypothetical protein
MTVAVIVHVEGDRSYVDSLQSKLEGVRLIACAVQPRATPVMAFDARLPLILVWSAQASGEAAERCYLALGRLHPGQTILCRIDGTLLPGCLERMRASIVDGSPRSSLFPGGLLAALTEARRRQLHTQATRPSERSAVAANVRRAFAEGVTRGLAGGVAVFSVGGAAALSFDQLPGSAPLDVSVDTHPDAAQASDAASENWTEPTLIVVQPPVSRPAAPVRDPDVPLAAPPPDQIAAQQAAAFTTDRPLEVWTPDSDLHSLPSVARLALEPLASEWRDAPHPQLSEEAGSGWELGAAGGAAAPGL